MRKSIILEGPNGSGKSTLGEKLSRDLGLSYVHAGPSPGDDAAAITACTKQCTFLVNGSILDRCTPISRQVYEKPISGDHRYDLHIWAETMSDLAFVIYCTGYGDIHGKDYYPPGHLDEVTLKREAIRGDYEEVMEDIPHITFNWSTDSYEKLLARLLYARVQS